MRTYLLLVIHEKWLFAIGESLPNSVWLYIHLEH